MTWSANYKYLPGEGEVDTVVNGVETQEQKNQYEAARNAAASLLNDNVLGSPVFPKSVRIVAHANPNHEPVAGWSNDFVTITVTQLEREE